MWNPYKNEILDQLDAQGDELVAEETKNFQISPKSSKGKYLLLYFHEVYFDEFPVLLFEWLERKTKIRAIRIPP